MWKYDLNCLAVNFTAWQSTVIFFTYGMGCRIVSQNSSCMSYWLDEWLTRRVLQYKNPDIQVSYTCTLPQLYIWGEIFSLKETKKTIKFLSLNFHFIPSHATTPVYFCESLHDMHESQWSTPLLSCLWPLFSICHSIPASHSHPCASGQFGAQPAGLVMTVLYCGHK